MTENLGNLGDFFDAIGQEKKKKEEEFRSVVGDIDLGEIFSGLKEEKKKIEKKKKKEEKQIEALEQFLFSEEEEKKEESPVENIEEVINEKIEEVEKLEEIEEVLDEVIEKEDEETIDHAIKVLDKITEKTEVNEESENLSELEKIKRELGYLRNIVNTQGGGGEVNLKYLDDIVGIATNASAYDGKFLKYNDSIGKFEFTTTAGGGYTLPTASGSTLGGVKIGDGLTINGSGVLSTSGGGSTGVGGTWEVDSVGINTTKNVGIGATAKEGYALYVDGNANYSGIITATTFSGSGASLNSIPNSALDNSTVSYGGVELALGSADVTPAFNLSDAINYPYSSLTGITTDIVGDTTPQLGGNLDGNSKSIFSVGVLTATKFVGDGSGLTGIVASGSGVVIKDDDSAIGTAGTINFGTNLSVSALSAGIVTVTASAGTIAGISTTGTSFFNQINSTGVITATSFDGSLATTDLTGTITNAQLAGSIANAKLSNSTVSYGGVELALGASDATPAFNLSDATNYPTSSLSGTITNAQLAGSIANAKLSNSSVSYGGVSLSLGGSDGTPAFDLSDATNYPTSSLSGTITNAQLAGSIANAKLANSTVSYGGIELALGASDATPAFNLSDATGYPYTSLTGISTEIVGDTSPELGGDLSFNSKTITGTGGVNLTGVVTATSFDGSLATTDLTGTITNAQLAGSIANAKLSNSSVSYGGISLSLGGSDATPAFDLSDATNYPTSSLSGTITNAQLAGSIAASKLAGSIGNSKLSNSSVSYGGISLSLGGSDATPAFDLTDATNYPTSSLSGTITNAQLAGSIANSKLSNDSVSFGGIEVDLGASDATPAFDLSDATNYPTSSLSGTITNAQLAGSIANSKLSNSTVSYGGIELALGASDATPAFNLSDATAYPYTSLTGISTEILGDTTPQLGGDLDFNSKAITGTGGVNLTGVITATSLDTATINSVANLNVASNALTIGDANDTITIAGNLTVNGTEIIINTDSLEVEDRNIGIASTASGTKLDNAALDGAGITIYGSQGDKTLTWSNSNSRMQFNTALSATSFSGSGSGLTNIPNSALTNSSVSYGGVSLSLGGSDATPAFDLSDATNYPTSSLSGTITNAQLAGSIANAKLANSSVSYGGISLSLGGSDATPAFDLSDATNYPTSSLSGTITNAQLAGSIANSKLANDSVSFGGIEVDLGASDATPAFDLSDATNYPTSSLSGTITNAQLAGSIANAKLSNSSVSYGGISLSLGGSDATPAFDLTDATNYPTSSLSGTITNAQLAGSIANAKLSNSSVSYGGVSLSLGGSDGTPAFDLSDATNYPTSSLSGTITNAQLAGSIADSKLSTISTAGKVDLAALEIDGGTDIGAALADADLFIVDDAAGGTNRKTAASRIKTYVADITLTTAAQTNITSLGTLSAVTVSGDITANGNITGDASTNISGISSVTASTFYDTAGNSISGGGFSADSQENLIAGTNAGASLTSDSDSNVLIGKDAGDSLTSGKYNVAIGLDALQAQSSDQDNVAIGRMAGYNNASDYNVFLGYRAGYGAGANGNIAIGKFAGESAAGDDIALGNNAMGGNSGGRNIVIGMSAFSASTSDASYNTVVGDVAGNSMALSGKYNVLLGTRAAPDAVGISSVCVVGHQVGNAGVVTSFSIPGIGLTITSVNDANTSARVLAGLTIGGTLSAGGLTYPTSDGSDGQVLTSDGAGVVQWEDASGGGTTINNNANNRVITGSDTANTLEAETSLEWDGTNTLTVVHGSSYPDFRVRTSAGGGSFELFRCGNGPFRINNDDYSATSGGDELVVGRDSGDRGMTLASGNDSKGSIFFGDDGDGDIGKIQYDHSANAMIFTTNTSERLRITSSGLVGIATASPATALHVYHASLNEVARFSSGDSTCYISFRDSASNATSTNTPLLGAKTDDMFFQTGGAERMRIDTTGRLLVGATSAMTTGSSDGRDTIQAVHTSGAQLLLARNDTAVADTNRVGEIAALTNDSGGNGYKVGGSIRFEAEDAFADSDYPTGIVFKTCADGSGTLTERVRIASSGKVGINQDSPGDLLEIHPASNNDGLTLKDSGTVYPAITGDVNRTGADEFLLNIRGMWNGTTVANILFETGSDTTNKDDGVISFRTASAGSPAERLRIEPAGEVLVNHTAAVGSGKIQSYTSNSDAIDIAAYSTTAANGGRLTFYRSKNATIGSNTEVADNDSLGRIDWRGYNDDGTAYNIGATIEAEVDGAIDSTTDMPSALVFKTSADGSSSPTERLRIDSLGNILIGTTTEGNVNSQVTIADSAGGDAGITIRSGTSDWGVLYFSDGTSGTDEYVGAIQYNHNTNYMMFRTATLERLRIDSTGHIMINTTSTSSNAILHINGQNNYDFTGNANETHYPIFNDIHFTGSDTLTANRTKAAIRNDIEYSVTSGTSNTSGDRLSLYGMHNTVNTTKAAYTSVAGYNYVSQEADNATGTQTVQGVYGYARGYGNAGVNYNIYGGYFLGYRGGNVNGGHCYGIYARTHNTTNGSGKGGDMTGVYSECEFDEENITNAYAFRGYMDRDAGTITNSYILYGSHGGDSHFTNRWGIHISDCAKSYLGGNLTITGTFEKGTDNFRIPHPLVGLTTTKDLVHSVIEGPQMDLIYRGKTDLVAGISTINIDTKAGMTEGTFVSLCRDIQCFTSNETGWTAVKGSVTGNKITIIAQDNSCTDTISWMVVGERQDDNAKSSTCTDNDGNLIVEPDKRTDDNDKYQAESEKNEYNEDPNVNPNNEL